MTVRITSVAANQVSCASSLIPTYREPWDTDLVANFGDCVDHFKPITSAHQIPSGFNVRTSIAFADVFIIHLFPAVFPGPYMKHGTDSQTLTSENQLFSIGLEEAIEIYKQPKVRRRGVVNPPLKELGKDPATEKDVIVKVGRFGVYVADSEANATLRRGDAVEHLTLERALELLSRRRAWELVNPGGSGKKKKKTSAKKSAPTLTEKTVKGAGAKKKAKKSATGVGKQSNE